MPHNELLDLLISQFSQAPYWSLKSLNEHVKQPQTFLKQTLSEIANLVRNGPYAGMWALKPEFKPQIQGDPEQNMPKIEGGSSLPQSGGRVKEEEGEGGNGVEEFRVKREDGDDDEDGGEDDDDEGMEFVS